MESLSINAASSGNLISHGGTSLIQQNSSAATNLINQKAHLSDPFDLNDSQILDKVYLTHVNDDEFCDTKILLDLVSNVITQSFSPIQVVSFKPEFPTLKLISCQMIATRNAPRCAHQTTLWILQHLRGYSWDAKALITLAAFTLEYGNYVHLYRVPASDALGSSLKQLNQVHDRKVSADVTDLVTFIVTAFQHIKQWALWSGEGYDPDDVPSLTEALQEIPVVVYWTIASVVAATGNLVGVSDYNLSLFRDRLSLIVRKLVEYLTSCKREIGYLEDYASRRKVFEKPKDIVDLLKALVYRNETTQPPQIYEGTIHIKTGLEFFRQKHVLLFISSLNSIEDEILLLNSLYERLQENPKEMKGFRKEDFKILWVPIVSVWDDVRKEQFRILKSSITFYTVEYFLEVPGLRIIQDQERGLGYDGRPIIPVFNPLGIRTNGDAMELIFQWGIDAFPFRKSDGDDLTLKWKWLWDVIRRVAPGLQVKGDRYIFIYGGTNKWTQDFTYELETIKREENIKRADVIIDQHQLGKDDPNSVHSFWIGIERKRQIKKHQEVVDCEIQGIVKSLFCLKRDPQGWAILAKGSNIKILGHGEAMYQTLAEFQSWKGKVLEKEGFDIAFKEYYDLKVKEISARQPCAFINVDNYASSVIATITCPNPTCGRVMEVTSVNYKCCHQDDASCII